MSELKVTNAHLERDAYLYIRQSTPRQVRNSADGHRLMELCENAGTLILDADGLYDPALFNDKLLLGLKGEQRQAELHFLKARMRGGLLNQARRGELEMRPPMGLVYRSDGSLGIDPDGDVHLCPTIGLRHLGTHRFGPGDGPLFSLGRTAVSSANGGRRPER